MKISILQPKHTESYWRLRLEALQESPEAFSTSYEEAIARDNPIEQVVQNLRNHYTFGAFENGTLVGVVTLVRKTALKLRYKAKIVGVYVTPTKRKCGIARRLLNEAIAKAKSMKGVEQVTLTVVSTNAAARNSI